MAMKKAAKPINDPWAKPGKPVKIITSVPKKVVEAKVKTNPNAPKPTTPRTGNVNVIPPKKKSTTPRGSSKKGARSTRGGRGPGRAGAIGGLGLGGGGMNWDIK